MSSFTFIYNILNVKNVAVNSMYYVKAQHLNPQRKKDGVRL